MRYFLVVILCWSVALNAAVYKWVDGVGNVSYSDTPPPGGDIKVMNLPEYSRYKPRALPKSVDTTKPAADSEAAAVPTVVYQRFAITKPGNAATVRSAEGLVPVELAIEPPLARTHYVTFTLDGVSIGERMQTQSFTMQGVERGTHSVQAMLIDAAGNQLAKTQEVRFTLRHDTLFTRRGSDNGENPNDGTAGGSTQFPGAGSSSSTPGATNPAFAPNYTR